MYYICWMKISQILSKINTELKIGCNIKNIISKKEEKILFEYVKSLNENLSFMKISKELGIGRLYIRKLMKKYNYKIVNNQNLLRVREDLFEKIETEQDAYWLGFLFADGYISDEGKVEISLNYLDYEHLLKFADYCGFDRDKVIKKQGIGDYFRCRIGFALGEKKERLFILGMIPRKSLLAIYPKINEDLHKHFIRGYFDGDGNINIRKPRTKNNVKRDVQVSILGTKDFLTSLNIFSKFPLKNIKKRKNISLLRFHTQEGRDFLHYMYHNSEVSLDRKYKIYQDNIAPLISDN